MRCLQPCFPSASRADEVGDVEAGTDDDDTAEDDAEDDAEREALVSRSSDGTRFSTAFRSRRFSAFNLRLLLFACFHFQDHLPTATHFGFPGGNLLDYLILEFLDPIVCRTEDKHALMPYVVLVGKGILNTGLHAQHQPRKPIELLASTISYAEL